MVLTNNILACNTCQTVVAQNFGNSLNGLLNGLSDHKDGVDAFADVKAASHEQARLKIKPYKAENRMLYFYTYIMNIIKNIPFPWMGTEELNASLEQSGSKGALEDCYSPKSCFDENENEKMIVLQENTSKANFCDNSSDMRSILTDFEKLTTESNSAITSYIEQQANEMKKTQKENGKNLGKDLYDDSDNLIMKQPLELASVVEKQIEENEDKLYKLKSVQHNKRKKKCKKRRKRKNSTEDSKKIQSQSLQNTHKGNSVPAKGKHQQNCRKKSCLDFVDAFAFPEYELNEAEETPMDLHLQVVLENDKTERKLQLKTDTVPHIINTAPLIVKEQVIMPVPLNIIPVPLGDRFRSISECESEDSFIVFGFDDSGDEIDGINYENLSDHGSDVHSLEEESDMEEVDDELPTTSETKKKKVRFAKGDELCKVHRLVMWSYAYQAARKGPWEEYARDRERFAIKILNLEPKLDKVLDPKLRQRIYRERFAD